MVMQANTLILSFSQWEKGRQRKRSKHNRARSLILYLKQFHVEDQRGVRRYDAARAARSITKLRRYDERPLAPRFHRGDAFSRG